MPPPLFYESQYLFTSRILLDQKINKWYNIYSTKLQPVRKDVFILEKITRTVTATTIRYSEAVIENGVPTFRQCADEIIPGECSDAAKLLQYLQKKYGAHRSFLITGTSTDTKKYEMDLGTFIATATATPIAAEREAASNEPVSESQPTEPVPQAQPVNSAEFPSVEAPSPNLVQSADAAPAPPVIQPSYPNPTVPPVPGPAPSVVNNSVG
ncbi:hypothetical protein [Flavonifractor sp. An306]|uniref:hypothetical protein n=1 Tax=Flavonifractor sp. An306 TaxID=1965629 RepID=UPI00174A74EC|nr:hypothetical protein [Flavonifractor sp. An306]